MITWPAEAEAEWKGRRKKKRKGRKIAGGSGVGRIKRERGKGKKELLKVPAPLCNLKGCSQGAAWHLAACGAVLEEAAVTEAGSSWRGLQVFPSLEPGSCVHGAYL